MTLLTVAHEEVTTIGLTVLMAHFNALLRTERVKDIVEPMSCWGEAISKVKREATCSIASMPLMVSPSALSCKLLVYYCKAMCAFGDDKADLGNVWTSDKVQFLLVLVECLLE